MASVAMDHLLQPNPLNGNSDVLHNELWHACAGPLAIIPSIGDQVYYFPQGHIEQELGALVNPGLEPDLLVPFNPPSKILCRVINVELMAEPETDQVYAKVTLIPEPDQTQVTSPRPQFPEPESCAVRSFHKILTITDTSNHGSLLIPKKHAEECLPQLNQNFPHQQLVATDLHGKKWHFQHVFGGKPKRHLLQDGWSAFVKSKKLTKGDVVIFLRGENGELRVGIRKFMRQETNDPSVALICSGILAIAHHAAKSGARFDIIYKPRKGQPEFIVNVYKYIQAQKHNLAIGIRFMMRFEDEELHEQRFNGQVVHLRDNISSSWPDSEWESVKVQWDEPSLTFLPEKVSPWELELPSNNQPSQRRKQAQVRSFAAAAQLGCAEVTELNEGYALLNKKQKLSYAAMEKFVVKSSISSRVDGADMEGDIGMNLNNGVNKGDGKDNNYDISQQKCSLVRGNMPSDVISYNECSIREHHDMGDNILHYGYASLGNDPNTSLADLSSNHIVYSAVGNHDSDMELMLRNDARGNSWSTEIGFNGIFDGLFDIQNHSAIPPLSTEFPILSSTEQQTSSFDVLSSVVLVPSASQQDVIETGQVQFMDDFFQDFHGFHILSKYTPYLQKICEIEGNFWVNSRLRGATLISAALGELGHALSLKDKTWNSLSSDELEIIIQGFENALLLGFKLDCLRPDLDKAKAVLASCSRRRQKEELEIQKSSLEAQLQNIICRMETLDLEHKSSIEVDFESKFLASIFN